ncbi:hypothetical protein ACT4YP_20650 (plasmid) [Acinetobacter baumannii]
MANFELASLSETHDLIVLIKDILEKATRQKIAYVLVDKMKKATGGVATKDAIFNMEEGQSLILTFRTDGDVIKTVLNNKVLPLSRVMDYDDLTEFKAGVEELALKIKGNQAKFDLARQKQRVEVPNDPTLRKKSIKKQTEELNTLLQETNTRIEEKKRTLEAKQNEYKALIGSTEGA